MKNDPKSAKSRAGESHVSSLTDGRTPPRLSKNEAQKEPVRLRERVLANGERSLYLDIYRDGKRSREFLKLYLVVPRTAADERERILYKNFIQVGEDVKAMLHEIQVFKAK